LAGVFGKLLSTQSFIKKIAQKLGGQSKSGIGNPWQFFLTRALFFDQFDGFKAFAVLQSFPVTVCKEFFRIVELVRFLLSVRWPGIPK